MESGSMSMRFVIILATMLSQGCYVATARCSEAASQRIQYAARLQGFFDSLMDGARTNVSAEGADSSRLRIVRSGVFREQFRSLVRPFLGELETLGFRSLVLCTPGPVCQETCVSHGSC
jgi:hypothetical protein